LWTDTERSGDDATFSVVSQLQQQQHQAEEVGTRTPEDVAANDLVDGFIVIDSERL